MKEKCTYIFVVMSVAFCLFFATGCDNDFKYSKDYSVYDGVTLRIKMADENNVLNLNLVNGTYRVGVSVTPGNVRINSQEYLYEVEDETIATVSEDGLLDMKKEGQTKLVVKLAVRSEIQASCVINVKPVLVNKLNVPETITMKQGDTKDLAAEISITPSVANCVLEYRMEDETIATVNDKGVISALKGGNTTLTVSTTDGSHLSETIDLAVEAKKYVAEILLPAEPLGARMLLVGDELNMGGLTKIWPEDAENPLLKFSLKSGEGVVSVTEEGLVSCLKAGKAVVQAEAQDGSGVRSELEITVYAGIYAWASPTGWKVVKTSALYDNGLNYLPDGKTGKPDDVLDENSNTFLSIRKPEYFTTPDNPNKEIYFVVDAGTETTFNMVRYEHRHLNALLAANKIEISGSNDGETFTLIKKDIETPFETGGAKKYVHEALVPSSTYRYIKVKVTDWAKYTGLGGSAVQMAEFNVGTVE